MTGSFLKERTSIFALFGLMAEEKRQGLERKTESISGSRWNGKKGNHV
jgi:hypothetical protein